MWIWRLGEDDDLWKMRTRTTVPCTVHMTPLVLAVSLCYYQGVESNFATTVDGVARYEQKRLQ